MTDKEPTKEPSGEQIWRLWEWCGLYIDGKYHDTGRNIWRDLQGNLVSTIDPPIDLNSLFRWAMPKLSQYDKTKILSNWFNVITNNPKEDPALALFWAIYPLIGFY